MLTVKVFQVNPIMENCYVVSDETNEACIIDCGCCNESEWNEINTYIISNNLKPVHLLCTHCHFDHIWGCGFASRDYNLKAEGSMTDFELYNGLNPQFNMFGLPSPTTPAMPPLKDITDSTPITFGSHHFDVIATPGHTQGGICLYCEAEATLFSGDTLFQGSIGRTDLPGGNYNTIIKSVTENLLTLPEDTKVYTGHGPSTTIGYEKRFNPFI